MKIDARITKVEKSGAQLHIEADGCEKTAPEGEWATGFKFTLKDERGRARSLHVGREITIEIVAKPEVE